MYSKEIFNEYGDVLSRSKFGFDKQLIADYLYVIYEMGYIVTTSTKGIVLSDMGDVPFYAVALSQLDKGAYLVTGNIKHFPKEKNIVTPRQMIEIIENNKDK